MRRIIGVIVACCFLAACTANMGYQFADTLIEWKINDYVELNAEQSDRLAKEIDELHQWHAQTQLPQYRKQLISLRDKIETKTLSRDEMVAVEKQLLGFWHNVQVELGSRIELLSKLSTSQRQQLIGSLEEAQQERYNEWQEAQSENAILRQLDRIEDIEETLNSVMGELTKAQKTRLRKWVKASPDLDSLWLDYRADWLTQFESALVTDPMNRSRLSSLILTPEEQRTEAFKDALDQRRHLRNEFLWELYQSLTPEQRSKVVEQADEYIDLMTTLINDFSD